MRERGSDKLSKGGVSEKMLVALVCCLMITMASGHPDREVTRIPVDWDMAGVCMILLMILGALVIWEGVKWGCWQVYHEYLPGATQRKLRRLQKIRDATTLAIQRELERIGESQDRLRLRQKEEAPKDLQRCREGRAQKLRTQSGGVQQYHPRGMVGQVRPLGPHLCQR